MKMDEAFNSYIAINKIVFSVDIKQTMNKNKEWKKRVHFPKKWESMQLNDTFFNDQKNGLAMLTGKINKIIVVDVDNMSHWKKFLIDNKKREPDTVKTVSASGGIHLYFKYSDELDDIRTSTHSFGNEYDIDIRNDGGCIFIPPTKYYNNKTKEYVSYKWTKSLINNEPIDFPSWMIKIIKTPNTRKLSNIAKSIKQITHVADDPKKITDNELIHDEQHYGGHDSGVNDNDSIDYDSDELENILNMISKKRADDYENWIKIGMAIYNTTNSHGFLIWNEFSKHSIKYDHDECKKKWASFKRTRDKKITFGSIIYWCKEDNPELYSEFKIKNKSDSMITKKYPDMDLELGKTIEVSGRKCTYLNNINCVFINKPHKGFDKTMFIEVRDGTMEMRCTHLDCIGKIYPCPSIRLTRNEMNIMNHGTINVTINNYSNQDDQLVEFQKYDIFENDTVNELVYNSLIGADSSFGEIIYYYFKDKYNFGEDNNWYIYKSHKWCCLGTSNNVFSSEIEEKLTSMYDKLIKYGKDSKMESNKINEFKKIKKSLGSTKTKRDIMFSVKEKFDSRNNPDHNFVKKLNFNRNLLIFKNGVYDIEKNIFRDGKPNDNMSTGVDYDYVNKHTKKYTKLLSFLSDIQPDEVECTYLLTYLSTALYGNMLEWFTIMMGTGRNGKSKFIELIKKTFSEYCGAVKSQMFTRPQPDASSPDPGLLNLQHKKIVIASEPEKREKLNSGFIKFITGRDTTQLRECHKNEMHDFEPKFVTFFVCNDIPETDELDTAFSKRLRCINFPTEFCDIPVNANQKLIDTKINENFDEWRCDFMLLLIEHFKKYMKTKNLIVTDNILKWTNQYQEETDIFLNFLNECTEDANVHIRISVMYERFKKWFVVNNPKKTIPSNREFAFNIKKHKNVEKVRIGNQVAHGIKKLKLVAEHE